MKKQTVKAPVPRSMDELTKANAELNAKAAQAQYLVYIYSKELKSLNEALESINYEAAERNKLDAVVKDDTKLGAV